MRRPVDDAQCRPTSASKCCPQTRAASLGRYRAVLTGWIRAMPHGECCTMPAGMRCAMLRGIFRAVLHGRLRTIPPRQAPHHATWQSPRFAAPASSAQCHMAIAPLCCPGTPCNPPPKTKKDRIQSSLFARRHPESDRGMRILQTLALPLGYGAKGKWSGRRDSDSRHPPWQGGTLPLSYYRILRRKGQRRNKCRGAESNHRHGDFQSPALPSELPRHIGDQEGARTLDLQRDRLAF